MPGSLILMSIITCPHCGHAAAERMPSNARPLVIPKVMTLKTLADVRTLIKRHLP